jgi:hypothetical protein
VFLQNSEIPVIFGIYGIIFLKKIHRIYPHHRGPGPPAPAHGSMNFIKRRSLATGSQRRGECVYANLNRRRAATGPGNGEVARPVLVNGEGSKDMR